MDKSQIAHDLAVVYVRRCLDSGKTCSDDALLNENARTAIYKEMLDLYTSAMEYFSKEIR